MLKFIFKHPNIKLLHRYKRLRDAHHRLSPSAVVLAKRYTKVYTLDTFLNLSMTTRTIGIKEFRQNISKLSGQKNVRFIVMSHSKPVFKVEPIDEDELILEKYADQIDRGLLEAAQKKTTSSAALRKQLNL